MRRGNTMNRKHLVTKSCTAALSLLMLASTSVVCIPNSIYKSASVCSYY